MSNQDDPTKKKRKRRLIEKEPTTEEEWEKLMQEAEARRKNKSERWRDVINAAENAASAEERAEAQRESSHRAGPTDAEWEARTKAMEARLEEAKRRRGLTPFEARERARLSASHPQPSAPPANQPPAKRRVAPQLIQPSNQPSPQPSSQPEAVKSSAPRVLEQGRVPRGQPRPLRVRIPTIAGVFAGGIKTAPRKQTGIKSAPRKQTAIKTDIHPGGIKTDIHPGGIKTAPKKTIAKKRKLPVIEPYSVRASCTAAASVGRNVHTGPRNGRYWNKTSRRTGNVYRVYCKR